MKRLNINTSKRIEKIILATVTSVVSIGMLSACGNAAGTEQKTENIDVAEENSFGLQDYEGFYCRTETEEMEGYEITYTYGYQFNGDGTGVCYGQDVVDITWNVTEIHFPDNTVSYVMEPGKLTVEGIVYDKIGGKLITPNPCVVDEDNIEDGSYYVYIDENGIDEVDGKYTIRAEIYTEDTYDIADIGSMAVGDVIYINGRLLPVNSIEQTDFGITNINGGIEEGGSALRSIDESNCYVYVGMDMDGSYSRQGIISAAVSDSVKLIDNHDPTDEKEYSGSDAVSALKEIVKEYPLTCYDGMIRVENDEIVEIRRMYRP